ncbi:hypothetical protein MSIBF_A1250003 [groundwater metagenome]|uniref:Uncharacterized protein n=1 Tax=groundwater metagenome TaxID=717931 RepID=A0A098E6T2_9ZZZZ
MEVTCDFLTVMGDLLFNIEQVHIKYNSQFNLKYKVTIQLPQKLKVNFLTFLNFLKFSQVNFCAL